MSEPPADRAATRERDCELNVAIACAVLREQCPGLAPWSVRYLAAGFDHYAFEVNGEWIVRMPMRAAVAARVRVELGALALASEVLALAVPQIALRGVPSPRYPYPFTGYRKLPGASAHTVPLELFASAHNARALGRALGALHGISAERAHAHGVPPASPAGHSAEERVLRVERDRAAIASATGAERARRYQDFLAERPLIAADAGARVLRHADLHREHVLLDGDGRASALIDWTDANTGDPSGDFVLLYTACGEPFVQRMLDAYDGPADPGLLERIRIRARWGWLHWVSRALEREPAAVTRCLACFDHVF
jgi:aminoglycoside phosphotransferase (APT) family kinase protein